MHFINFMLKGEKKSFELLPYHPCDISPSCTNFHLIDLLFAREPNVMNEYVYIFIFCIWFLFLIKIICLFFLPLIIDQTTHVVRYHHPTAQLQACQLYYKLVLRYLETV